MKTCSKCGIEKEFSDFSLASKSRDGLSCMCKSCTSEYHKAWYTKNRERRLAQIKAWTAANPEKSRATIKVWIAKNPEKTAAYSKTYYNSNRDRCIARSKVYKDANRDKFLAAGKARYHANKEKMKAVAKNWWAAHRDVRLVKSRVQKSKRRAWKAGTHGTHTAADLLNLRHAQDDRCAHAWCKVRLNGGGHVDHILPLKLGGSNGLENLQLLCVRCNTSKGAKHPNIFYAGIVN